MSGASIYAGRSLPAPKKVIPTPHTAKKTIHTALALLNLPPYTLTARTVYFTDLARMSIIFVKIHGWKPSPIWETLSKLAVQSGFRIES